MMVKMVTDVIKSVCAIIKKKPKLYFPKGTTSFRLPN